MVRKPKIQMLLLHGTAVSSDVPLIDLAILQSVFIVTIITIERCHGFTAVGGTQRRRYIQRPFSVLRFLDEYESQ
jgi:hypothetical protein